MSAGPKPAEVYGCRYPELEGCVHCGAPVRAYYSPLGDRLEHYDPAASFGDSVWWHCRLTVATRAEPAGGGD